MLVLKFKLWAINFKYFLLGLRLKLKYFLLRTKLKLKSLRLDIKLFWLKIKLSHIKRKYFRAYGKHLQMED